MVTDRYDILVLPLPEEDGGGYIGLVPDLQGCMSDGESRAEALANTELAIVEYVEFQERMGRPVPEPGSAMARSRQKYQALIEALRDMTTFAEQASAEVATLRDVIDHVLAALQEGNWSESAVSKMVADTRESLSVH